MTGIKSVLVLLTAALLALGSTACGGAGNGVAPASSAPSSAAAARDRATATTVTLPQPELKSDADEDSDSYGLGPDEDTSRVFGHPASAAEARAVTALVRHYYAAAAAGDGFHACPLIYSPYAESIAEDYGGQSAAPSRRGKSCAEVMSKLFEQAHRRLRGSGARLKVAAVRVLGHRGSVLLGFGRTRPKRYLQLHRERGAWKIDRLLDTEQPVLVE